jgi:hypothetical protein
MKTIIVGYTDRGALSAPKVICGPEVSVAAQADVMQNAKRLHKFPEGLARVEQYLFSDPIDTAIFIDEDTANACQNIDARRKQVEKQGREKVAQQQKAESALVNANKVLTAAAVKRNLAIADIATQRNLLANNPSDKDRAAIIAKIEKLQPAVEQSVLEFKAALASRDAIRNPEKAATPKESTTPTPAT